MTKDEYTPLRRRGARRAEGDAARLRGAEVLRGLSAGRGDGRARRRRARLRADEAGGADRPAHRPAPARGGAAAHGGPRRHRVEPGRLPDAAHLARAEAHLRASSPGWRRPSGCAWGRSTATPSSTRRGCWRRTSRSRPSRASSSPGRSPASRATSSRRPAATWRRSSLHARLSGAAFAPPPATTALGALYRHVTGEAHPDGHRYQPTNVVFALFPPLAGQGEEGRQARDVPSARTG